MTLFFEKTQSQLDFLEAAIAVKIVKMFLCLEIFLYISNFIITKFAGSISFLCSFSETLGDTLQDAK